MRTCVPLPDNLLTTFWAKSTPESSDSWRPHPLLCHMIDVACVAQAMWDDVLSPRARQCITSYLGLSSQEQAAGRWVAFWAGLHDLGKASPAFQLCVDRIAESLRKAFTQACLSCTYPKNAPHGHVTAYALRLILGNAPFNLPKDVAATVAAISGGHHGLFPTSADINALSSAARGGTRWDEAREAIAQQVATALGLPTATRPTSLPPSVAVALAGLISVADWIASDEHRFKHAPDTTLDNLPDYVAQATRQARQALHDLAWSGWTPSGKVVAFSDLFPYLQPNSLQQATVELASQQGNRISAE
jgi:CRISPR-associated endonuclease/helicase Cas3